jgi:hypothetical protein
MAGLWRAALAVLILVGHVATVPARAADPLPTPTGDVVLTVTGAIAVHNDGAAASFDMAMLEALPQAEIKTETPWTEGMNTFTGFKLADLLSLLGAEGSSLGVHALNDYETEIPLNDVEAHGVVVAYRMNGEPMPTSDKGPLWILYPYSADPDLQIETYYNRAVWNLDRLTVQ